MRQRRCGFDVEGVSERDKGPERDKIRYVQYSKVCGCKVANAKMNQNALFLHKYCVFV